MAQLILRPKPPTSPTVASNKHHFHIPIHTHGPWLIRSSCVPACHLAALGHWLFLVENVPSLRIHNSEFRCLHSKKI